MVGIAVMVVTTFTGKAGEVLYNGIVLPDDWPPKIKELSREPLAEPPYLKIPPAVIPIDVGRQLFVDNFLIESSTLTRTHHLPQYYPGNPVIKPDQEWEKKVRPVRAAVFSDGVFFDPSDKLFKAWYWSGSNSKGKPRYYTCYATSRDGLHWDKPVLDVVPDTNVVLHDDENKYRNSNTVWLDLDEKNPQRRFKMFRVVIREKGGDDKNPTKSLQKWITVHFSPDGIHWKQVAESDPCGDRTTVFYNAFRKLWVFGLRDGSKQVSRCRAYHEATDILQGLRWSNLSSKLWVGADDLDPAREDLELRRVPDRPWDLVPSQLYNLDCVAYESVMLGMFSIWRGHPAKDRPKINEVCVGFSRDGFHWTRPDRRAFCPVSEKKGDWNWGNVQSAGGCCLVVGDKLYVYVGGTDGSRGNADPAFTGLAILRRDGFTSMDAGETGGTLTTRKLKFTGKYVFVNVAIPKGELRVEILDADGKVIEPFTKENCVVINVDNTIMPVAWKGAENISVVAGKHVKFRFHIRNGELYSFWVSPGETGASHGYVAAGGPGFSASTDTVGVAAYDAAAKLP